MNLLIIKKEIILKLITDISIKLKHVWLLLQIRVVKSVTLWQLRISSLHLRTIPSAR